MTKLWSIVVAAFGLLGAALLFVSGQRDRAKEAASRAKAEAKSKSAVMEAERAIDKARAQAREKTKEVEREDNSRPSTDRPSGGLRRD